MNIKIKDFLIGDNIQVLIKGNPNKKIFIHNINQNVNHT